MKLHIPSQVSIFIEAGAIFYVSHSGGKDSQAMYALLQGAVPHEQIVVVHANLGDVEWPGVIDHISENITHELNIVQATKTFLGMVEARGMWPSPKYRQCTSDLKRGPIQKFIRGDLKSREKTLAVDCTGIRAEESPNRAKRQPFTLNKTLTNKTRTVYSWLPIFDLSTESVFQIINDVGQVPFWAYEYNDRLSCVFCIMGSLNDLRHGARRNPKLYRRYVDMEKQIGHTLFMKGNKPIPLNEYIEL
ncbi:phosphoadenosine phosphosulfate reductase family protein [Xenorhabdus bovienii]|uniref:phosphoadenosine phosphosulfate reductase domain-containing protein n=1 Tax=Xenorhabdus bovienii TaxID=40576 RepID=UPI0023B3226C|nr:phosphoadenosine phosphosulfate reductase family protein [Xenorhabdus bovienii]MDE9437396.1 phosphoadenosine phosphosulfate reductase family protein [Xenorhabdus bovienii]MDE9464649.1 phosphoadenosine phosphosulfate reductase family protein [Xenorhabdus bovienii]MDE9499255.1 phosphoadenosine phosphosulfate reductase family protein [Xenorhabdus bovienii]